MDVLEKVEKLPEDVKEFFHSNEVRLLMERACFLYDINEDDIEKITMPIAGIFLHEVELKNLPIIIGRELKVDGPAAYGISYELNAKIFSQFETYFLGASMLLNQWNASKIVPIISEEKAHLRILDIEPWILEQEKEEKEQKQKEAEEVSRQQAKIEKLSLEKALEKYPALGEQAITSNPIKLRYFPTSVKASVKNWIADYRETLGPGKHSTMDRGNFLFHGENGKRLTPIERQKVSLMLKSLDEEIPLDIDGEKQLIIFNVIQEAVSSIERPPFQAESVKSVSQEEVAEARIKQSLDFAKKSSIPKENISKSLEFEDSNYADVLREKIGNGSKATLENPQAGGFGQSEVNLRFSSAQELPVEKTFSIGQNHNFAVPKQQKEVVVEKTVQASSSSNFKGQPSQTENVQPAKNSAPQDIVRPEQNKPPRPQRVYSPYVIGPTNQYEKNSDDMGIFKKNSPKIQGNTVDLS